MIQGINIAVNRNITATNSKFLNVPQTSSGNEFRDVLAANRQNDTTRS